MSYDLWVWAGPALDNVRLAHECDLDFSGEPSAFLHSPALPELIAEVGTRFPPLESLSDEEVERSPWSVSPEASRGLAAFALGFPSAPHACPVIVEIALGLGLRAHDPQTGTTYTPFPLVGGSGSIWWEPKGWGCAALWRWGGDAVNASKRRKLRLTLGTADAAIVSGAAASFVRPVGAGAVLGTISFPDGDESRPPLVIEPLDGAVLVRYRRSDEGAVVNALSRVARQHSLNFAAPLARSDGAWYLVAGDLQSA